MKIGQPPQRHHVDWQLQLINIVFLLLLFFVITGTISTTGELIGLIDPARDMSALVQQLRGTI